MSSTTTSTPVLSGFGLLLVLASATAGCTPGPVLYERGTAPVALPPRAGNYENPDNYRVDSAAYPTYVAKYDFLPPEPREGTWVSRTANVEILTTDIWHVTHRVQDQFLIFSDTYQDRQCNYLLSLGRASGAFRSLLGGPCIADNLYELYISSDGKVFAWMFLKDPKQVARSKDRYTIMDPTLREGPGWPEQPLFEPVH